MKYLVFFLVFCDGLLCVSSVAEEKSSVELGDVPLSSFCVSLKEVSDSDSRYVEQKDINVKRVALILEGSTNELELEDGLSLCLGEEKPDLHFFIVERKEYKNSNWFVRC